MDQAVHSITNLLGVRETTEDRLDDLGVEQPQVVAESSPGRPGPLLPGFCPRGHLRDDALVARELLGHLDPLGGPHGRQLSQTLGLLKENICENISGPRDENILPSPPPPCCFLVRQ